eukprot:CAMPEP_0114645548 /NCGR_PEP_ID=MMETSP0191-20121206/4627_1 /TAXON_ID=126664 /ORGANISM="Sorites sp." /LENGTH=160 /DNA_ID=CAMNT_0001858219 /DNA_START=42 /DNA_END=525 /DNA_ORIENTATION=+
MSSFGVPPDPARIVSYFPGMSARSFSPVGANVCYRESIMKENAARSDAFESALRLSTAHPRQRLQLGESLPGLGSINSAYSGMGWTQNSVGRWLPPSGAPTGLGESQIDRPPSAPVQPDLQVLNPRVAQVTDIGAQAAGRIFVQGPLAQASEDSVSANQS